MKNLTIEELKEIVEALNKNRVQIDGIKKVYSYSFYFKEFRTAISVYCDDYNYAFSWDFSINGENLEDFKTALDIYIDKIFIELKQLPK